MGNIELRVQKAGSESITEGERKSNRKTRIILFLFFSVFAAMGGWLFYRLGIWPVYKTMQSRNWKEVSCKIISAEVGSHSGDHSSTYSIDIVYEYNYEGKTYRNDRYDFIGGSSSGYNSKWKIVSRYKDSVNPVCFVNPENPEEAILKRGFHLGLFIGIFPLLFLGIGVAGLSLVTVWWGKSRSRWAADKWLPQVREKREEGLLQATNEEVVLKNKPPLVTFLCGLLIAIFWNGIVSVFLYDVIHGWKSGHENWFKTLFMIPFVIIGIVIIIFLIYLFLALFNPRPNVTIKKRTINRGDSFLLNWKLSGRTKALKEMLIFLRCREEASYQQGKSSGRAANTFFQMEIFSSSQREQIDSGQAAVVIPTNAMHSFESEHNKIIWEIVFRGDIKYWPDLKAEYKIIVSA